MNFRNRIASGVFGNALRRRAVQVLVVLTCLALPLLSCKEDENPGDRELAIYLLACPTGPFVCYQSCFTGEDSNANNQIDGSEVFGYNICNQGCSSRCSLAWIFYYAVDE